MIKASIVGKETGYIARYFDVYQKNEFLLSERQQTTSSKDLLTNILKGINSTMDYRDVTYIETQNEQAKLMMDNPTEDYAELVNEIKKKADEKGVKVFVNDKVYGSIKDSYRIGVRSRRNGFRVRCYRNGKTLFQRFRGSRNAKSGGDWISAHIYAIYILARTLRLQDTIVLNLREEVKERINQKINQQRFSKDVHDFLHSDKVKLAYYKPQRKNNQTPTSTQTQQNQFQQEMNPIV